MSLPLLLAGRGLPWRRLVTPSLLAAPLGLTRAHTPSTALAAVLGADGATWAEIAQNTSRFAGAQRRLVTGLARTNGVRNPRAEGAAAGVVGSGGALPTNWTINAAANLVTTVVSAQEVNGVETVTLRIAGTANATAYLLLVESTTQIVATPSQPWSAGIFARLDAAPTPPLQHRLRVLPRTAAGANIAGAAVDVTFTPGAGLARVVNEIAAISADGTVARITSGYVASLTSGQPYDFTVTLGWPTLEQAAFASDPVLPVAGTPAAATRAADLVSATLASLGVAASGACTMLWRGALRQIATGTVQGLFAVDDGTASNYLGVRCLDSSGAIQAVRVTGGGAASTAALGTAVAGTAFGVGLSIDGAGAARGSFNGGAVAGVTGGPSSGLTTARLASIAAALNASAEVSQFRLLPRALPDAQLQAAILALPA